jgi:site-specific DNA-cytosine methylase
MRALVLNTYAGSLLLGASQVPDIEIIGSYEDAGYGSEIQEANFPHLNFIERTPWPDQNLEDAMVIAHPPCAAFSIQTPGKNNVGVDAKKFKCTVEVAHYALRNRAAVLAIESVPGALEGARQVHDEIGREHGYNVFRITQNAVSFGVPQFRPRFWVVFSKLPQLHLGLTPKTQQVLGVIMGTKDPTNIDPAIDSETQKQIAKLIDHRLPIDDLLHDGVAGLLPAKIAKLMECSIHDATYNYCLPGWLSSQLRILDPLKPATTLLGNTWWYVRTDENQGRPLTVDEYNAVMGFPRNYIFPDRYKTRWRDFLSRGVCPPVAEWIVRQLLANLLNQIEPAEHVRVIRPGEIANFIQGVV